MNSVRTISGPQERIFGSGEMAERIRSYPWHTTALGPIAQWPDALVIVVNTLVANQHPMVLAWGDDMIQMYNDAAIPAIGPDKHPQALGRRAKENWVEIWEIIEPQLEAAQRGEACWREDQLVPIYRGGRLEDAWFTYSYSPVRDAAGEIGGVLITTLETTGRIHAERALRGERSRLLALFQQAPAFFAVLKGPEHLFEMVNPLYSRLIGGRDVAGKPIREALPEAAEQGYVAILDRVYNTGEPFVGQNARFVLAPADGFPARERIVDFVYQPLREADGSISGILVFGVDMTERKQTENLLREQRERFGFATDAAQIGYWFCDLPFDRLIWDERVKEQFWLPPDAEVDIRRFFDLLHPDDRERTRRAIEDAIASHTRYDVEYRTVSPSGLSPSGQEKWIRAIGRTAYDATGKPVRFDGVTMDITALKDAEAARDRAEEALIRSEKLALVGRLAATISHEINNPLEAVTNLLFLIENLTPDEQSRAYTRTAQSELARVSHIVTHTLRFNRQTNKAAWESISELLDSSIAIYEARLRHADITVVREYAETARLLCFGSELRQVFVNLIANSFDATREGGRLIVRTREQKNRASGEPGLRVTIADTGSGMDRATQRCIFDAFFTTKGDNGTGLGLWVTREILNKHRAAIRLKSRQTPGLSGTVFSIWLPLSAVPAAKSPGLPAA